MSVKTSNLLIGFLFLLLGFSVFSCGDDDTVSSIKIFPGAVTVGINKTKQFSAIGYSAAGRELSVTPSWNCSTAIGTISAGGLLTASGVAANGTVTANLSGMTSSCAVSITDKAILNGTVTNLLGTPLVNMVLTLSPSAATATTNGSGVFSFSNITAGTVMATTAPTALYLTASAESTLAAGETNSVVIIVPDRFSVTQSFSGSTPTVLISGTITNNADTQADGVTITYSFTNSVGENIGGGSTPVGPIAGKETVNFFVTATISEDYADYARTVGASSY
jgi:hypothetical protein